MIHHYLLVLFIFIIYYIHHLFIFIYLTFIFSWCEVTMFEFINKNRIFELETSKVKIWRSTLSDRIQHKPLTLLKLVMLQTYVSIN